MRTRGIKTERIEAKAMSLVEFLDKYVTELEEESVVAITSKVVALCEGRVVPQDAIDKVELAKEEADFWLEPRQTNGFTFFLTIKDGILIQVWKLFT